MADRIPLIVDSSTKQVKELPASDNLDLSSSGIINATSIGIGTTNATSKLHVIGDARITGVMTATSYYGDGSNLSNVGSAGKSIAFSLLFGS